MNEDKEQKLLVKPLHVGVSVSDIDASIEWYKTMLGFRLVSDQYIDKLPARLAFLEHGDFSIELFEIEGAAPLPDDRRVPNLDIRTHGNKHVAYAVQDIRALMDTLKAKHVDVAMDVFPMGLVFKNRLSGSRLFLKIHPGTAARHEIKDGEWVFIETPEGRITQKAKITPDIRKDVIGGQHAWWFPEEPAPDYGWQKSNLNLLYGDMAYDPDIGAEPLRGVLCRIYR